MLETERYKNFFNLLIAYKQSKKIYNNFKLAIFGGGEFSKQEIKIFDENKIDSNKIVKISGGDDILANLYENAELFVFPSKYEVSDCHYLKQQLNVQSLVAILMSLKR